MKNEVKANAHLKHLLREKELPRLPSTDIPKELDKRDRFAWENMRGFLFLESVAGICYGVQPVWGKYPHGFHYLNAQAIM